MESFALWAVAKCLCCWLFPDKLALSNPARVCLTELGFRSRTSWTQWLGKKPFLPRRRPSNIPLLSSPQVTEIIKKKCSLGWKQHKSSNLYSIACIFMDSSSFFVVTSLRESEKTWQVSCQSSSTVNVVVLAGGSKPKLPKVWGDRQTRTYCRCCCFFQALRA